MPADHDVTVEAAHQPAPERLVAGGRYRIVRLLGTGGQKEVHLARDTLLERDVALAFLRGAAPPERFAREMRLMGRLGDHAHIVGIYDVGEEGGASYLVSQYLAGGSVGEALAAAPGGRLEIDHALAIAADVAEALAFAHAHGVVHRDVKPANVWLRADGAAALGDFGIALTEQAERLTGTDSLLGTVLYMAPEQLVGDAAGPASDLYALGAMLQELLTGAPPFRGENRMAVVYQHLHAAPAPPSSGRPEVPAELDALVLGLLAKEPGARPGPAAAVRDALRALLAGAAPPSVPGPAAAAGFVGRRAQLERLAAAAEDALAGRGRLVLLAGEPGIGKTRLAEEAAGYAVRRGAAVLWGRCSEGEGAPPYWPWVQVVRAHLQSLDEEAARAQLGAGAAEVARIVRAVREHVPDVGEPEDTGPEDARFRFMESTAALLRRAAAEQPLVLVLDDLHWADQASLILLDFLAHELAAAPVCIVATYRDARLPRGHPFAEFLGEARRAESVQLRGLSDEEVARYVEATAGAAPGPRLAGAIHRHTEGNPFYVAELVRLLHSEGRLGDDAEVAADVPHTVRDVVRRRLHQRSDACDEVLAAASVLGRDFRVDVVRDVTGRPGPEVLEALDEAVAAHFVLDERDDAGRARFAHALVRETVYLELPRRRRLELHFEVASVLERRAEAGGEADLDQLAHHFFAAAELGGADRAVEWSRRAGARADASLAYEEAVAHRRRALQALELDDPGDARRRCLLLLELGEAETRAGELDAGRERFVRAGELAARQGFPDELARAALGATAWHDYGLLDTVGVRLLEDALAALPAEDTPLRARVLGLLSTRLGPARRAERDALSAEAVAMARRLGDPAATSTLLKYRAFAIRDPATLDEQLEAAGESLRLAQEGGDLEGTVWSRLCRLVCLLERGDVARADVELEAYASAADELRQSYFCWYATMLRGTRALLAGDFEDGEALSRDALAVREEQEPGEAEIHVAQMVMLGLQRGTLGELERGAELRRLAGLYSLVPAWEAMAAAHALAAGREAEAREALDRAARDGFAAVRGTDDRLSALVVLAGICAELGAAEHAAALHSLLEPWAGHCAVLDYGWAVLGSVSRPLGALATLLGRHDEAVARYEAAARLDTAMGAHPWVAHDLIGHAEALLARGGPDAPEAAAAILAAAAPIVTGLGMPGPAARLEAARKL
jgi:hypothetical protein